MYSSEDLERFYFHYRTEALPHGESIETFCLKNDVPYNIFRKWYKDTRKQIVEVQVDGCPSTTAQPGVTESPEPADKQEPSSRTRIMVDIRVSNGLRLFQKDLSYQQLCSLVEKLEGLC